MHTVLHISLWPLRASLYGIEYVYLIAGEPGQLNEKIQQALNLNAWPTTFFVGRDGLVREIHTGFTSPAANWTRSSKPRSRTA